MAYMESAICLCCGETRAIVKDPMLPSVPHDPYCSDYCRKRAELGKCEVIERLVRDLEAGRKE